MNPELHNEPILFRFSEGVPAPYVTIKGRCSVSLILGVVVVGGAHGRFLELFCFPEGRWKVYQLPLFPLQRVCISAEGLMSPAAAATGSQVLNNTSEASTPEGRRNIFSRATQELLLTSLK